MKSQGCKPADVPISDCQRQCLLHVLRNLSTALIGATTLVENKNKDVTCAELLECLQNTPRRMQELLTALKSNSFCPLNSSECVYVAKLIGCTRKTSLTKGVPSSIAKSSEA